MQPHVLTKLVEFPDELKDTKMIQRFLGVLNYIHKYIPRLSKKSTPIRKHLKSGWSSQAIAAVKISKKNVSPAKIVTSMRRIVNFTNRCLR